MRCNGGNEKKLLSLKSQEKRCWVVGDQLPTKIKQPGRQPEGSEIRIHFYGDPAYYGPMGIRIQMATTMDDADPDPRSIKNRFDLVSVEENGALNLRPLKKNYWIRIHNSSENLVDFFLIS